MQLLKLVFPPTFPKLHRTLQATNISAFTTLWLSPVKTEWISSQWTHLVLTWTSQLQVHNHDFTFSSEIKKQGLAQRTKVMDFFSVRKIWDWKTWNAAKDYLISTQQKHSQGTPVNQLNQRPYLCWTTSESTHPNQSKNVIAKSLNAKVIQWQCQVRKSKDGTKSTIYNCRWRIDDIAISTSLIHKFCGMKGSLISI